MYAATVKRILGPPPDTTASVILKRRIALPASTTMVGTGRMSKVDTENRDTTLTLFGTWSAERITNEQRRTYRGWVIS